MSQLKRNLICLLLGAAELASAPSVFAADRVTPQPYPWPSWGEMQWPAFGWIFPLLCFVMMVAMLLLTMRRGGMGCMPHGRSTDKSDLRNSMKRSWSEQEASAMEILNERYAKGEIDKKEYEEKRATIVSSV